MQTTTNKNVRKGGRPFAATISAPRANGSAKIVWEKRIKRRNLDTGPPNPILSPCRSFAFTANDIQRSLTQQTSQAIARAGQNRHAMCEKHSLRFLIQKVS